MCFLLILVTLIVGKFVLAPCKGITNQYAPCSTVNWQQSLVIFYWSTFVNNIPWSKVWLLSKMYMITNKIREISFKILHTKYHYMVKFRSETVCSSCSERPETVLHVFWHCCLTKKFWKLSRFVNGKLKMSFLSCYETVIFGFVKYEPINKAFILNL